MALYLILKIVNPIFESDVKSSMFLLGWWLVGYICWGYLVIATQRPLRSWNNLWPFGVPGSCFKAAEPELISFRNRFKIIVGAILNQDCHGPPCGLATLPFLLHFLCRTCCTCCDASWHLAPFSGHTGESYPAVKSFGRLPGIIPFEFTKTWSVTSVGTVPKRIPCSKFMQVIMYYKTIYVHGISISAHLLYPLGLPSPTPLLHPTQIDIGCPFLLCYAQS